VPKEAIMTEMNVPTTAAGIAKIYGVSANNVQIDTKGNITISFSKGQAVTINKEQLDNYYKSYCLLRQDEMSSDPEAKQRAKQQKQIATYKISPDGKKITFKIKPGQNMNIEDFKQLFHIKDGAFRSSLRAKHNQAKFQAEQAEMLGTAEVTERDSDGELYTHRRYDLLSVVDETDGDAYTPGKKYYYSDGVIEVVDDDAGHRVYDYTEVDMSENESFTISADDIKDMNDKGLFGLGFWIF
jgi:Cu/Ag efflux protein CusF